MLLLMFYVSADDLVVIFVATMPRRGGHIVDYSPVGGFTAVSRKMLRPKDVWG